MHGTIRRLLSLVAALQSAVGHRDVEKQSRVAASASRHRQLASSSVGTGRRAEAAVGESSALEENSRIALHAATNLLLRFGKKLCRSSPQHFPGQGVLRLWDLRACFPYLDVPPEREACPRIQELQEQLSKRPPPLSRNSIGNSGAEVLMAPGREHEYVVKSIKEKEVQPILQVVQQLQHRSPDMPSLIAPVCFMATLRYAVERCGIFRCKHVEEETTWIVMRRMRLSSSKEDLVRGKPNMFDVKGPIWVKWDGKTVTDSWFGGSKWQVKDLGFKRQFPYGLHLGGRSSECAKGCIGLQNHLRADVDLLESEGVLDFSLLFALHDAAPEESCLSEESTFPALFEALDPLSSSRYVVAAGIIDFGESTAASRWKIGSTMVEPSKYRKYFGDIWGDSLRSTLVVLPPGFAFLSHFTVATNGQIKHIKHQGVLLPQVRVGWRIWSINGKLWQSEADALDALEEHARSSEPSYMKFVYGEAEGNVDRLPYFHGCSA